MSNVGSEGKIEEHIYIYLYLYLQIIFPKTNSKTHLSIDGFLEIVFPIGNGNHFFFMEKCGKFLRFITVKLGMWFLTREKTHHQKYDISGR